MPKPEELPKYTEPIETTKPTTGHYAALQRDEIQLHQPEHRHKLSNQGKHITGDDPIPIPQGRLHIQERQWTWELFIPSLYITLFIPPYIFLHSH